MAFDFPANPTLGQVWGGPNGADYKWDGVKWTGAMNEAGAYLSLLGGTTSGPISVPAGASGAQVPQMQEVVSRSSIIGEIADFFLTSAPENWLPMLGGTHLRADYPALWDLIRGLPGVGNGDGSTTFVLPNWNRRFRRASVSGTVGQLQDDLIRSHDHDSGSLGGSALASGAHQHAFPWRNGSFDGAGDEPSGSAAGGARTSFTEWVAAHSHILSITGSTALSGGGETRPTNVAVLTCIRAR